MSLHFFDAQWGPPLNALALTPFKMASPILHAAAWGKQDIDVEHFVGVYGPLSEVWMLAQTDIKSATPLKFSSSSPSVFSASALPIIFSNLLAQYISCPSGI
jgi:hypothetical protein